MDMEVSSHYQGPDDSETATRRRPGGLGAASIMPLIYRRPHGEKKGDPLQMSIQKEVPQLKPQSNHNKRSQLASSKSGQHTHKGVLEMILLLDSSIT